MFLERIFQEVRPHLPHMMTLARESKPQSVEAFRKYCFDHIDFESIFNQYQITNKRVREYILDKAIDKTYMGWVMEEKAKEIIRSYGWEIVPITEELDRKGVDILAVKDNVILPIQVKSYSILTTNDIYAQRKRYALYHGTDVKLMIYQGDDFMKFGGKYLINPKSLFDEKGNTTLCFLF